LSVNVKRWAAKDEQDATPGRGMKPGWRNRTTIAKYRSRDTTTDGEGERKGGAKGQSRVPWHRKEPRHVKTLPARVRRKEWLRGKNARETSFTEAYSKTITF